MEGKISRDERWKASQFLTFSGFAHYNFGLSAKKFWFLPKNSSCELSKLHSTSQEKNFRKNIGWNRFENTCFSGHYAKQIRHLSNQNVKNVFYDSRGTSSNRISLWKKFNLWIFSVSGCIFWILIRNFSAVLSKLESTCQERETVEKRNDILVFLWICATNYWTLSKKIGFRSNIYRLEFQNCI